MADELRLFEVLNKVPTFNDIYPVGSIYMNINNKNPSTLFGGTWIQIEGRFLLSAGGSYAAGDVGGNATHTLNVNEMPNHTHKILQANNNGNTGVWVDNVSTTNNLKVDWSADNVIQKTGGSQPFSIMPPYLVVYMWQRTA